MQFRSNHGDFEYYAKIRDLKEEDGRCFLTLDRSDFFVEGGGQPSDRGSLAGREILSLNENEGEIWHEVENGKDFFPGMRVKVVIDREHRLEMSRQHTGQHLFSALLFTEYGKRTIGFHVGEETTTIDTDAPVDETMLETVSQKVLEVIRRGIPVTSFVERGETLQRLGLQKEQDFPGDVQVIRIGDLDVSACCGTHVDSTAELLFFIVRKAEKHKEGTRIYFQFGHRALAFAMDAVRIVQDLKEQLEVHETEIPFRVTLLREEASEHIAVIEELRMKLVDRMLAAPDYQVPLIYQELDGEEEFIKELSRALNKKQRSSLLLDLRELRIYGNIFMDGLNAGKLFREHRTQQVRGGGGATSFQGVADTEEELKAFAQKVRDILEDQLK